MKNKDIGWVCNECGKAASYATQLLKGKKIKQIAFDISTYHIAKCDCCGRETWVTEARDFFYPNFELINGEAIAKYANPNCSSLSKLLGE